MSAESTPLEDHATAIQAFRDASQIYLQGAQSCHDLMAQYGGRSRFAQASEEVRTHVAQHLQALSLLMNDLTRVHRTLGSLYMQEFTTVELTRAPDSAADSSV